MRRDSVWRSEDLGFQTSMKWSAILSKHFRGRDPAPRLPAGGAESSRRDDRDARRQPEAEGPPRAHLPFLFSLQSTAQFDAGHPLGTLDPAGDGSGLQVARQQPSFLVGEPLLLQ
jgi:hypothetical protein